MAALEKQCPEVLAAIQEREARRRDRAEKEGRLGRIFREAAAQQQQQQQQHCNRRSEPNGHTVQNGSRAAANGEAGANGVKAEAPAAASSGFTFGFAL